MNRTSRKALILAFCIAILLPNGLWALRLLRANVTADSQEHSTFFIPIGCSCFTSFGTLYTGAADAGADGYTIAHLPFDRITFNPLLAPKSIDSQNPSELWAADPEKLDVSPLFNAAIAHLGLIYPVSSELVLAVRKDQPSHLYSFGRPPHNGIQYIHHLDSLHDALGQYPIDAICALETTNRRVPAHIFAAVRPHDKEFGAPGSGIAVLRIRESKKVYEGISQNDGSKRELEYLHLDFEQPGARVDYPRDSACATPLEWSSLYLRLGSPLAHIDDALALRYEFDLHRLYVGICAQAGPAADDGVRALAVGHISDDSLLIFHPCMPDLFTQGANDEIIGAKGAGAYVSLHHIRAMYTSTLLPYLIIVGGNGQPDTTRRSVYALPVLDQRPPSGQIDLRNPEYGTIASKHSSVRDIYAANNLLAVRVFEEPARTRDDIYTTASTPENAPAHVGGGPLAYGDIKTIYVKKDTVYAVVAHADPGTMAGVFSSQALFDERGVIKGWTSWRRYAGTYYGIVDMYSDDATGECTFIVHDPTTGAACSVVKTEWGTGYQKGSGPLIEACKEIFPQALGGIHGLFMTYPTTYGTGDASFMIALGHSKIMLAQIGIGYDSYQRPLVGDELAERPCECTDGTLASFQPTRLLTVRGGALEKIGIITSAAIARGGPHDDQAYMVVAGSGGLALARNGDGSGWDAAQGLGDYAVGLPRTLAFETVGDYRFIRKILADGHFLYIVTPTSVDRIDLRDSALRPVTLATIDALPGLTKTDRFFDLLVSDALALIATSRGLYRIGNGVHSAHTMSADASNWTPVPLPAYKGATLQLYGVSWSGNPVDSARGQGGMVYVVTGNRARDYSRVYRLSIKPTDTHGVTQETVAVIDDKKYATIPSSFMPLGAFRDGFATDGALNLRIAHKDIRSPAGITTGSYGSLPLPIQDASHIAVIERNPVSGSWLIAGDFGLLVHE